MHFLLRTLQYIFYILYRGEYISQTNPPVTSYKEPSKEQVSHPLHHTIHTIYNKGTPVNSSRNGFTLIDHSRPQLQL
ncbi:unnamed protein product [Rhizophagus irregularis]|nr:unnamed protein product [Rhizophagus irregularis]CAB5379269.1 unnamed protein product [Rhizophagus irregularis]